MNNWKGDNLKELQDVESKEWNIKERKEEEVEVDIWDVTLNPTNSFNHNPEQLKLLRRSYEQYGALDRVIVDQNNVVVAGHGRIMSLRQKPPKKTKIKALKIWFDNDLDRDAAAVMLNTSQWFSETMALPLQKVSDRLIEAGLEPLAIGLEKEHVDDMITKAYEYSPEVMADTTGLVGVDSEAGMKNITVVKLFFDMSDSMEEYSWFLNHYDLGSRISKIKLTKEFCKAMIENERKVVDSQTKDNE